MKLNLLKKLLILSPIVISPVLVAACGTTITTKLNASGNFYLDYYQKELNAIYKDQVAAINTAANSNKHQYNLQSGIIDKVLTKVKTDGASEFKKELPNLSDYNVKIFDDIKITFSIPKDSSGNLKLDNNVLTVYPANVINTSSEKQIDYSLTLNNAKAKATVINSNLKLDLKPGFDNYNDTSSVSKLISNKVFCVYGNASMSTLLVGTAVGLDVGKRQANGSYKFDTYTTSGPANKTLNNEVVNSVWGSTDMKTILVGEEGGGLDVGTKQKDGSYDFVNYSDTTSGSKLSSWKVWIVYGNNDLSRILVGTGRSGLDVGTRKQPSDPYAFTYYSTSSSGNKKLSGDLIHALYAKPDMTTILVGTRDNGLDVGTDTNGVYWFKDFTTSSSGKQELASNRVYDVYGTTDLSTILVGENGGGLDVGQQNGATYDFTNYSTSSSGEEKLNNNEIWAVSGNADLSTILVGEDGGGLDVGTKQADGKYNFTNYTSQLGGKNIVDIHATTDLSTILLGEDVGGLDISSNLWFA